MRRLIESRQVTLFGYVRGNALDFSRVLRSWMPQKRQVIRMGKNQSGTFHVPKAVMFKLTGDPSTIEGAISDASMNSSGSFVLVKKYSGWVPGFLSDVPKE